MRRKLVSAVQELTGKDFYAGELIDDIARKLLQLEKCCGARGNLPSEKSRKTIALDVDSSLKVGLRISYGSFKVITLFNGRAGLGL